MIYRVLFSLLIFLVGVLGASLINYSLAESQQTARPVYLDQGWTSAQRKAWYTTSQGSRLLQASWMRALEVEVTRNFSRRTYVAAWLPAWRQPTDLPVGFAVDSSSEGAFDTPALGMTCAACHTVELRLKGKAVRIDGAPTLANYEAFMAEFLSSLKATHDKDDKFARFAAAVLGAQNTKGARATLKSELEARIAWYAKLAKFNHSGTAYGHGRLDAQGHILNKIALVTGADQSILQPPDAPVSYPFIWNAHQHDRIQWNGMLTQMGLNSINVHGKTGDLGALVRNVGEVLGVFAEIDVEKADWERGFKSSVRVDNLIRLEGLLTELQAPKWPEELLGPIKGNVKRGADLFNTRKLKNYASNSDATATCSQCHQALQSDDTTSPVHAYMQPVMEAGTDMWAACNVVLHKAGSGNMEGGAKPGFTARQPGRRSKPPTRPSSC
jgi:cytochrome c553